MLPESVRPYLFENHINRINQLTCQSTRSIEKKKNLIDPPNPFLYVPDIQSNHVNIFPWQIEDLLQIVFLTTILAELGRLFIWFISNESWNPEREEEYQLNDT